MQQHRRRERGEKSQTSSKHSSDTKREVKGIQTNDESTSPKEKESENLREQGKYRGGGCCVYFALNSGSEELKSAGRPLLAERKKEKREDHNRASERSVIKKKKRGKEFSTACVPNESIKTTGLEKIVPGGGKKGDQGHIAGGEENGGDN